MTGRHAAVLGLVGLSALSTAAALAILAISFGREIPDSWGFRGFPVLWGATFTCVGAALVWRRPNNRIGWLLLVNGVVNATQAALAGYALLGIVGLTDPLAGAVFCAWIVSWIPFSTAPVGILLLLLFPNGHFLSPRWRAVAWLGGLSAIATSLDVAFTAGPLANAPYVNNPFPLFDDPGLSRGYTLLGGVAATIAGAAASLVLRYRRSGRLEQQQLKWLAFAGVVMAIGFTGDTLAPGQKLVQVFLIVAIGTLPLVIGVAVLRYRLYDIDVVINRALVYVPTTATIAVAFFAGIVVLQAVLRPLTGGSEVAVAVSTLASFTLFQPLRARVQRGVDRRFYRSRYDSAQTLDDFSVRLRDEVDLDAVRADLLDLVGRTVQPASTSLWLREAKGAVVRGHG